MAINQELRRRKGLDAAAEPAEQTPLSPAERDAAIAAREEANVLADAEVIGRKVPKGQKAIKQEQIKLRAAQKAAQQERARAQADKDGALLPPPLTEPTEPLNGRTLTLHEQNQLRKLRDRQMRDENREIVNAVAKAAADTLGNVVDRRRHSRVRRAMDAQSQAQAAPVREERKGEGFTGLYGGDRK